MWGGWCGVSTVASHSQERSPGHCKRAGGHSWPQERPLLGSRMVGDVLHTLLRSLKVSGWSHGHQQFSRKPLTVGGEGKRWAGGSEEPLSGTGALVWRGGGWRRKEKRRALKSRKDGRTCLCPKAGSVQGLGSLTWPKGQGSGVAAQVRTQNSRQTQQRGRGRVSEDEGTRRPQAWS